MDEAGQKRPVGIALIAVLWFFSGLANVYFNFQTISQDVQALPYLSDPTLHTWLSFGVPAEMLISILNISLGLLQIVTVLGLWTGKAYSYKLALIVPVVLVLANISAVGLYASAPAELNLGFYVTFSIASLFWSIIWVAIYWQYLGKPHVKAFLGVEQPHTILQEKPNPPIQENPFLLKEKMPDAESKFYCRYCGTENKTDAVYCERCGKNIAKRASLA